MVKIENEQQYKWAVERVEELLPLVKDEPSEESKYGFELELLSNLVADYSDEHFQIGKPKLADVLRLRMYELGLSQKSLADMLGVSPSRVSNYLTGKCEPTLKVAKTISSQLNIDPSIVLGI